MKKSQSVLYPGSFDPVTRGHVDVILRLGKLFEKVVVLVADSPRKNYLFTREERVELIQQSLNGQKNIEVESSNDLTVNFAKKKGISIIARSVRTVSDWEYEYSMADANRRLAPGIETLFIMADSEHGFISSSLVREVAAFDGDTSPFVMEPVQKALKKKRGKK